MKYLSLALIAFSFYCVWNKQYCTHVKSLAKDPNDQFLINFLNLSGDWLVTKCYDETTTSAILTTKGEQNISKISESRNTTYVTEKKAYVSNEIMAGGGIALLLVVVLLLTMISNSRRERREVRV